MMLGDAISKALNAIGFPQERASKWLGKPCHCEERRQKLNQLHAWAIQTLNGKLKKAQSFLEDLIES